MASLQAAKKLVRSEMKKRIAMLSKEEILRQSENLTAQFLAHPAYIKSQRVAVYLSMADEVQTDGILASIFALGKTCFIPWYSTSSTQMSMLRLYSLADIDNLSVTKWNVKQPADTDDRENALYTGGLDLVLVPGIAFSADGHRMGRGKGYYDTFLQKCRELQKVPPITIALALSPQVLPNIPTHEHDVVIDFIITLS